MFNCDVVLFTHLRKPYGATLPSGVLEQRRSLSQGSRNGGMNRRQWTQKLLAHRAACFPAQFSTLGPKSRTLPTCLRFLFPCQPGAHVGRQSPSRVQPSANKVHLIYSHSGSRSCSGCRDPMRPSPTLTRSPRDTEDTGVRSHHCRTPGLHPAHLRHLAPPPWAQALLRGEAPDSGKGVRPWLDLRNEKIIVTSSSKGAHCVPSTPEELCKPWWIHLPPPHAFLSESAVLYYLHR